MLIATGLAADRLGLSQPGFSVRQVFLAGYGAMILLVAAHLWFCNRFSNKWIYRYMVGVVIIVGALIRSVHLFFVGFAFPFRYGALFLEFSEQIAANGYRFPDRIPFFTEGGIPFAYPPLPFYVQAALIDFFSPPIFMTVNLLPAFIAVLTVPSFYILTIESRLRRPARLIALLSFAVMPIAFTNQIEAAGLAEAFGTLAIIWFAIGLTRTYRNDTIGNYILAGFFWAICVVSSPGSAYASVPMAIIFSVAKLVSTQWRFSARMAIRLIVMGVLALILSAPYWLTVIRYHGMSVFMNSFLGQHSGFVDTALFAIRRLGRFDIARGPFPFLWNVAIFSGMIFALIGRRWALLVWFVVLLSIPREGGWMAGIPAALLAGIGVERWGTFIWDYGKQQLKPTERLVITTGSIVLLGIYLLVNPASEIYGMVASKDGLTSNVIAAMEWVEKQTPLEAKFIVISSNQRKEWFPQIARRTVLNMPFGSEWEPEERTKIMMLEKRLEECLKPNCVQLAVRKIMGYEDDTYIFVDKNRSFDLGLMSRQQFKIIWQNDGIAVVRLNTSSTGDCSSCSIPEPKTSF